MNVLSSINRRRFVIAGVFCFALVVCFTLVLALNHPHSVAEATGWHIALDMGTELLIGLGAAFLAIGMLARVICPVIEAYRLGYEAGREEGMLMAHPPAGVVPMCRKKPQQQVTERI
jgi:hypothetical protein